MTLLASIALSWIGVGLGLVIAIGLSALVIWLWMQTLPIGKFPASRLALIWVVFGAWLYSGAIYQAGVSHERQAVEAAVNAEQARQRRVTSAALEADRAAMTVDRREDIESQQEVDAYAKDLAKRPNDCRRVPPADAARLRQLYR